jgi:hypothetical protein
MTHCMCMSCVLVHCLSLVVVGAGARPAVLVGLVLPCLSLILSLLCWSAARAARAARAGVLVCWSPGAASPTPRCPVPCHATRPGSCHPHPGMGFQHETVTERGETAESDF